MSKIEPWTSAPLEYGHWCEKYKLPETPATKESWALWVIQVEKNSDRDTRKKSYRKISREYHPDLGREKSDTNTMALISQAKTILGL